MTYDDVQTVAVLGGWPFLFAVLTVLGLAAALLAALYRLAHTIRVRRQAASDLTTCCALWALPTTEPTKD